MIDIKLMRAAGMTLEQIVRLLELEQDERLARTREQNRIRQRNHRARNDVTRDQRDQRDNALSYLLPSSSSLSSLDSPTEAQQSKEVVGEGQRAKKKTRQSKVALASMPPDWRPNNHHSDLCAKLGVPLGEVEAVFRDTTAAKGVRYANWDLGFNTYIRNFNKFNGGNVDHGKRNRAADRAHELAEEVRQREFEIGFGRPPKHERSG
jgi:DNA-binding transcriptional MerR regulator